MKLYQIWPFLVVVYGATPAELIESRFNQTLFRHQCLYFQIKHELVRSSDPMRVLEERLRDLEIVHGELELPGSLDLALSVLHRTFSDLFFRSVETTMTGLMDLKEKLDTQEWKWRRLVRCREEFVLKMYLRALRLDNLNERLLLFISLLHEVPGEVDERVVESLNSLFRRFVDEEVSETEVGMFSGPSIAKFQSVQYEKIQSEMNLIQEDGVLMDWVDTILDEDKTYHEALARELGVIWQRIEKFEVPF